MNTNDLYMSINSLMAEINTLQNEYARQGQEGMLPASRIIIRQQITQLRGEIDQKIFLLINMNPFGEEPLTAFVKEDINH